MYTIEYVVVLVVCVVSWQHRMMRRGWSLRVLHRGGGGDGAHLAQCRGGLRAEEGGQGQGKQAARSECLVLHERLVRAKCRDFKKLHLKRT